MSRCLQDCRREGIRLRLVLGGGVDLCVGVVDVEEATAKVTDEEASEGGRGLRLSRRSRSAAVIEGITPRSTNL